MAYDMGMQARTVKSTILQSRVPHCHLSRWRFFKIFTPAGWLAARDRGSKQPFREV
jgi:hypothetical protein